MALFLTPLCRLHHQPELHRSHGALEGVLGYPVTWARSPGEVMNVVAVVSDRLSTVPVLDLFDPHAARAHNFVLRQSQTDFINAEIGEEFGGCVILMAFQAPCHHTPTFGNHCPPRTKSRFQPLRACVSGKSS